MKLSQYFSLTEFTASDTAARVGLDNSLPEELVPTAVALCEEVLDKARIHLGPIRINSGYRSPALNSRTPGSSAKSQHTRAEAADIIPLAPGVTTFDLLMWIYKNCDFDQLIWEFGGAWVHVSHVLDGPQRGSILSAVRVSGKRLPAYTPITEEQMVALGATKNVHSNG